MSTMAERKPKRQRRNFTDDFKAGAIRLVLDEGRSVATVARDLDLTESSLRNWVEQAKADAGRGRPGALTTAEREELTRLRRENRILQEEREILKKAAAFFAKERR
jgi:transposase